MPENGLASSTVMPGTWGVRWRLNQSNQELSLVWILLMIVLPSVNYSSLLGCYLVPRVSSGGFRRIFSMFQLLSSLLIIPKCLYACVSESISPWSCFPHPLTPRSCCKSLLQSPLGRVCASFLSIPASVSCGRQTLTFFYNWS